MMMRATVSSTGVAAAPLAVFSLAGFIVIFAFAGGFQPMAAEQAREKIKDCESKGLGYEIERRDGKIMDVHCTLSDTQEGESDG